MQCGLFDKGMKYKNESFSVLSFYCAIQRFNMASKPAPSVSHRLHSSVCVECGGVVSSCMPRRWDPIGALVGG